MAQGVPEGFRTLTPSVCVKGGAQAIDWYKKAFGAEVKMKMEGPGGGIAHAELKIGDSILFLSDEFPMSPVTSPKSLGGTTGALNIYASDCDAWYKRAVDAGAESKMPPTNMFWGDRYSQIVDPFGHVWGISTNVETLSEDEIKKRSEEFWKQMATGKK